MCYNKLNQAKKRLPNQTPNPEQIKHIKSAKTMKKGTRKSEWTINGRSVMIAFTGAIPCIKRSVRPARYQ